MSMTPHTKLIEALKPVAAIAKFAGSQGLPDSHTMFITLGACRRADEALRIATETTEPNAAHSSAQSIRAEALEVLDQVEAVMSIVEPRSDKREYLETLGKVRAAIRSLGGRG